MLRTAFRVFVRVALLVGVAASFGTGCSRQAEGERCDYTWAGDQDCDDGLVCTQCGSLQDQSVDRCCKPGGAYSDTRCVPTSSPSQMVCNSHLSGTGGSGGTGATGGTGNTTGEAGSGAMSGIGGATDTPDGG
jgi:hypothetical protein